MSQPTHSQVDEATMMAGFQAKWSLWFGPLKTTVKLAMRIASYTSYRDKAFLGASILASVLAGGTLPLMNIIFAQLVKTFTSFAATPTEDGSHDFMRSINQYVLYTVYLFIARLLLAYIAMLGFRMCSLRISAAIRFSYIESLFKQPISVLDALPPGQTAAIVTITANILQNGISERLATLIQAVSVILTALIIACYYSWSLALVTSSGLVIIALCYAFMTPIVVKKSQQIQEVDKEASGIASDAFLSIRMVAACGAERKIVDAYNRLIDISEGYGHKLSPVAAWQHSPVFFCIFTTFALCFWFAVKLYLGFHFPSVKTLVIVLMSVMTILSHITAIAVPLMAASHALTAASIFFTIIDAPKPRTGGRKGPGVQMNKDIVLEKVYFAYPTRPDVKVLNGLDLTIPFGKTTAIVGPSGSGKSTVVALVQRWYQLDGDAATDPFTLFFRNGTIKTEGLDLHDIELIWWRSQIGLVQQDPFLFNDTILRNLELGLVGTEWEHIAAPDKKLLIEQACKEAYAHDFITALPEGYDTQLGDNGIKLSGGQRQRIAIARAICKNPKILIFDEATSALDVASERIVQEALEKVSHKRTAIVIAHRLSTVQRADNIVVMAKGKVVQQGTHDSLLAEENGAYWNLVHAQRLIQESEPKTILPAWERFLSEKRLSIRTSVVSEIELATPMELQVDSKETDSSKVEMEGHFFRSFGMLMLEQKCNWMWYLVMAMTAAGAGSSYAIQSYLFARLLTSFGSWGEYLRKSTNFLCLMLVVVAFGVGLCYFVLGWVSNAVSTRTKSLYRKEYFRNMVAKPIPFFDKEDNSVGTLTARLATDPTQLQQLLGMNMAMVFISIFNMFGCITISIYFGWKFALVVIAASMPIIIGSGYYRVRHEVKFETRNNEVFAESAKFATEAIRAIRTVAALTLEQTICSRYQTLLDEHIKKSFIEARFSMVLFAASDSLVLLCMAFALWYGGTLLSTFEYHPFNFFVIYYAILQGSMAAGQWLSFGPNIAQVTAAATRIHNMRGETHLRSRASTRPTRPLTAVSSQYVIPLTAIQKGADISFRDVWFTYPTRPNPVLRGLSFSIRRGQFAAFVGPSGSGKTTIISLLERFYEPQHGNILYNSDDVRLICLRRHREQLSLVAQEPSLFRGSIRSNILLGVDERTVADNMLHRACQDAGIHDFIASLPQGYETDVGTGGVALSGGQKQRLSIARALIRDPSVLLLDEATSSLDSETEREVQAVFERTTSGRTMIVVAHRLTTVQRADVIFVMQEGRIVERGDHRSLLAARGWYWQMCQAQAML